MGLEGVLSYSHVDYAGAQSKIIIMQDVLLGAGYDKCLQILGEIPKSKLLLESD